ncbi:MAG TPA: sigma-70 family RNA polymerase sigma factor [Burkholderiales bacterium]|nr:sigma-70 family RNA polymerase sigma factor [Burkholderiales bacterium]
MPVEDNGHTEAGGQSSLPEQLAAHRDYLYRFALAQLRDENHAEDVVQETLLAAVQKAASFSGRAQLRTWLTGILKHKIIDVFRQQTREALPAGPEHDEATLTDDEFDDLYFNADDRDHWRSFPQTWANPERSLEQKRFWEVFDACTKGMPAQTARVFILREFMGLETEEICKELGITTNNCWVLLYRARMNLRQCLEMRWFDGARQ